jgi:hypothetical protein
VTKHRTPWEMVQATLVAFDDDVWETVRLLPGLVPGP